MAHKKTNRWIIVFCTLLVGLTVNAQQWHTTLDVLRPAQNPLPEDIRHLLIVNNTARQPDDYGHTFLTNGFVTGHSSVNIEQAPIHFLFSLSQVLDENNTTFDVSLLEYTQNTSGSFGRTQPLTIIKVDSLCRAYQTDAALICNRFLVYDTLEIFLSDDEQYYAGLTVYEAYSFTLQYAGKIGTALSITHTDTLYWESQAYTLEEAIEDIPQTQTAIVDMASYAGEKFALSCLPRWETVDRYFYENKDTTIQRGMVYLKQKQWDIAIKEWTTAYNTSKNKQTRAYAAANNAVAYEIQNDIDNALRWARYALKAFSARNTPDYLQQQINIRFYIQQLEQRQTELSLL